MLSHVLGDTTGGLPVARRRSRPANADVSNPSLNDSLLDVLSEPLELPSSPLSLVEDFLGPDIPHDRRTFRFGQEPEKYRLMDVSEALRSPQSGRIKNQIPVVRYGSVGFQNPDTTAICVRRKIRKEVLIAKRKRGKGGARKMKWYSKVRC